MKTLFATLVLLTTHDAIAGFACDAHALTKAEHARSRELATALKTSTEQRVITDTELALRIPSSSLRTAAEWIDLERRCCPFLDFELTQARDQGPTWLRVRGESGAARVVEHELGL